MGLLTPILKRFDELEEMRDDKVKKFNSENFSILLLAGSLDTNLSRKYLFWTLLLALFNYAVLLNQDWMLLYSSYLLKDDFETGSGVLNYGLLITVSVGFLLNFHFLKEECLICFQIMSRGIFHYADKQVELEDMAKFRKLMKFQRNVLIALAAYVCTIGVIVVLGPVIDESMGHGYDGTYDENGINRRLPVPLFFPFETSEGIGYLTALAMTTISGTVTCTVIGGASFFFSTFSQVILTELKILSCSLRTILTRALKRYCRIHKVSHKSVDKKKIIDDPEFQDCITDCLKENIKHHMAILKFSSLCESITRIPLMLCFLIVSLAIGLSMMKLNEDIVKVGSSFAFASVALGELFNMLNVAVYGEYYITMSQEVNWEIYFTPWYKFNLKNKKMIRRFLLITHKPLSFTAWIIRMDMEMFASVINSAYSFFNFVKLSKNIESESG